MADRKPTEKYETWPSTVRYDGVFDFDGMYKVIIEHLRRHNYWFYEKLYKHKPWSPIGTELILKWEAERKLDEYNKYMLKFEWHFMDMHHVEVIRDGQKVTLTKAYFWVNITGVAIRDWQALETVEDNTFTKWLGKFYRTTVSDREWTYDYIYPLFGEVMEINQMIQNYIHTEASRIEKYVPA